MLKIELRNYMFKLLNNQLFSEHHNYPHGVTIHAEEVPNLPLKVNFRGNEDATCFEIDLNRTLSTSYYIGVDWVTPDRIIYVEPKLNVESSQTNYLQMLLTALEHPDVFLHCGELFEIKFDKPHIEIDQTKDLLTPLLVIQFLRVVQEIVRKGLKKSYYKVEQNLYCRVKGKLLVSKTISQNIVKNKNLHNYCSYDVFGFDGLENRLIKKALLFSQHYLPIINASTEKDKLMNVFNYILPAFEGVSDDVDLSEIKQTKFNAFYKEYSEAIRLSKLILKRFGYNITNAQNAEIIKTPPFWIDMSKLFELYVLGLLKDKFDNKVTYHFSTNYQELDYVINAGDIKMVVDAKYKVKYLDSYRTEDIRQVSGYARLESVYKELEKDEKEIIDCLIIYPDQQCEAIDFTTTDFSKLDKIKHFVGFYKLAVKLPMINDVIK